MDWVDVLRIYALLVNSFVIATSLVFAVTVKQWYRRFNYLALVGFLLYPWYRMAARLGDSVTPWLVITSIAVTFALIGSIGELTTRRQLPADPAPKIVAYRLRADKDE